MASYLDYGSKRTVKPKTQKVENPPFCWVILKCEGNQIFVPEGRLTIFETWQDAQDFIDAVGLMRCTPKLFFWDVLLRKSRGLAQQVAIGRSDGTSISSSLTL